MTRWVSGTLTNVLTPLSKHTQLTETMVYRLSKSSGIEGLAGMSPLSSWANYPDIGIARPFLDCSRVSLPTFCTPLPPTLSPLPVFSPIFYLSLLSVLQLSLEQLCRDENLPWVARGDTMSERGVFKSVPRKYDGLRDGLLELISLCRDARDIIQPQGREITSDTSSSSLGLNVSLCRPNTV